MFRDGRVVGVSALFGLILAGCGAAPHGAPTAATPPETAAAQTPVGDSAGLPNLMVLTLSDPELATFSGLVKLAGLEPALAGNPAEPLTVFAPNNAAFAALPTGTLEALRQPANREGLTQLLTYHLVDGLHPKARLSEAAGSVATRAGLPLHVDATGVILTVGDSVVIDADRVAANGVVHVVEAVLLPPASAE